MKKNKEKIIVLLLIVVAIIINFVNSIFFCTPGLTCINPFYSIWSFLAFLAGTLGVTIFPLGIAAIVSILFILSKKHKYKYIYYFSILFFIFSLLSLYICYAES